MGQFMRHHFHTLAHIRIHHRPAKEEKDKTGNNRRICKILKIIWIATKKLNARRQRDQHIKSQRPLKQLDNLINNLTHHTPH